MKVPAMGSFDAEAGTIETRIPSRLDRLPWSKFRWMVIIELGTLWTLDGPRGDDRQHRRSLRALFFGQLTDPARVRGGST